jgi:hypothetical protein
MNRNSVKRQAVIFVLRVYCRLNFLKYLVIRLIFLILHFKCCLKSIAGGRGNPAPTQFAKFQLRLVQLNVVLKSEFLYVHSNL